MHRNTLNRLLVNYLDRYPENKTAKDFIRFVDTHTDCFERSRVIGHVTGSAWVVDPGRHRTLLVHHRKLNLWLQPGGHCDGDHDVARVAHREVQEETGLTQFELCSDQILDLDIHTIPAVENVPEHLHYDVRFLVYADSRLPISISDESHDVRWFQLHEVKEITPDISVLRLVQRTPQTRD